MLAYSAHVMTLANSIIGVGILAMPFCFQKCGIVLAAVLLIISNWITRICCHYLIKSSLLTRRKSFEFLGFHAFGSSGKLLVELCIIGFLFGTCITFFVVVGDLGPQIMCKVFSLEAGDLHLRTWIMIGVTLVCILPMGMLKNVDSLSTVCTASIGFYVCLVIKIVLESEEHILTNDWTERVVYWRPAGILQCLPIFSMALSCQMQLFEVFESINNQSLEKLNGIVRNAIWICTFVYIAVGFFGYVAFCTQEFSGNILMSLSSSFGSDVIKIGFILSVAFSFPLVIFPCRASIYSLLYRKGHADASGYIPETRFKVITTCIVGCALCIALMIPSIELIIGLVGSTIGVAICIMFPAACFRRIVKKDSTERSLAQFILVGGFCLMILGTYANLNAIDEQRSGPHLEVPQNMENIERDLKPPTEIGILLEQERLANANMQEKLKFAESQDKARADAKEQEDSRKSANVKPMGNAANSNVALEALPERPPLPVDEKHAHEPAAVAPEPIPKAEKPVEKLSMFSPKPELVEVVPAALNASVRNKEPAKIPVVAEAANLAALLKNATLPKVAQQQTIDRDAIKKDEEVAAEEQKNIQKQAKSVSEEELKKTQNELKETKKLLERTVGELKEELAKQNKETQNLVVEKLGEVAEKVEQIDRKVQQKELVPSQVPIAAAATASVQRQEINAEQGVEDVQLGGLLLNMLADNAAIPQGPPVPAKVPAVPAKVPAAPAQVYEPLSYKTGELIEHTRQVNKLDQRPPLPLALLLNASHIKLNGTQMGQAKLVTDSSTNKKAEPKAVDSVKNFAVKYENGTPEPPKVPAMPDKENPKEPNVSDNADKENIEAIRRDILQMDPAKLQDLASLTPTADATVQRMKRSSDTGTPNFKVIDAKLQHENCLTEPKVETLLAHGMSSAIDFKMQSIGRDLKSVKEDETE